MGKYNLGEVWWLNFPFDDQMKYKDTPFLIRLEAIPLLTCFFMRKNTRVLPRAPARKPPKPAVQRQLYKCQHK